jgi:ElaA protein
VTGYDVRLAAFDELDARTAYLLWQLRESVFVVEQQCAYPELDGLDLDPGTRHVWVESDGAPASYLRVLSLTGPGGTRIGRVLVAKPWRGRGLAEVVVRAALEAIGDRPSSLDSQSYLAHWYTRFGYERAGPEFLEDGIPHVPMRREGPPQRRA